MITALAHAGVPVVVEASQADCVWLAEFLRPSFSTVGVEEALAAGAPRVRLNPCPASRDGIQGTGSRIVFAFDSGPVRLPEVAITGGARFTDPVLDVAFDITADGATVRFDESGRLEARLALMRVVREYVHNHAVDTGGVVLHAAAVATRHGAIAVAGPKNAGKTTLALQLLVAAEVGYLSNDRLLVRPNEGMAHGIPTVVALRAGTRHVLPALTSRLEWAGDFRVSVAERAAAGPAPPATWRDVWYLSPAQVCSALDRPLFAAAPLVSVMLVGQDAREPFGVRRLEPDEAAMALMTAVLGGRSGAYASDIFTTAAGPRPETRDIERRCERLASKVACFAVTGAHTMTPADAGRILLLCLP